MRTPEVCLHQLVEAAARSSPAAPAVVASGRSLRYDELLAQADRLARRLLERGVGEGAIVALDMPRSPDLIVAQLAVLKTGAAYLALDRAYPRERKRFVLEDARPAVVITSVTLEGQAGLPGDEAVSIGRPESPAYVTYTSGSTGQPKGVLSAHRGAVHYISHMIAARDLRPGERVLQFTSLGFDGSVRDTLGTLAFGGTIVLLDDDHARDPRALVAAIREEGATLILAIVPTMLRRLTQAALAEGDLPRTLRLVMVGGETLLRSDVEAARRAFGAELEVVNQYGATECSMVATNYTVPAELPDGPALPIGKPIADNRVYILDRDLAPVAPGDEGEIFIGGVGVGLGYLNRPELTAERFLRDPHAGVAGARMYRTGDLGRYLPDASIEYLGREDQQVKIRGHRVELGEIESVLREHPAVRQAAVVSWTSPGRELLAGYVALRSESSPGDLRAFVAARVPFPMVPSFFVVLEELPLTETGKVDRKSLPRPGASQAARVQPRTLTEARLVSIWESVLCRPEIGVTDDFFELGGDSLQAMELLESVERELGRAVPVSVLFEGGTIEAFAREIEKASGPVHPGIVPLQPRGTRAPLFLVPAYLYLRELASGFAPDRPVYAIRAGAPFTRPVEEEAQLLCESLLAFHPEGPYLLAGHSAGGYLALETARALARHGKRVDFLGLLDTLPPGPRRQATPLERVRLHIENFSVRDPRGTVERFTRSAKRLALRMVRRLPGNLGVVRHLTRNSSEPWLERLVVQRYVPEPYPGDVTLFVVAERPWYVRWDPMERWERHLAGRKSVVLMAGTHLSVVLQPQARLLAREIESLLPR